MLTTILALATLVLAVFVAWGVVILRDMEERAPSAAPPWTQATNATPPNCASASTRHRRNCGRHGAMLQPGQVPILPAYR
jgi:hypothetical protein